MSEIDLSYRQLLREQEKRRLDAFMAEPEEEKVLPPGAASAPDSTEPLGPPSPSFLQRTRGTGAHQGAAGARAVGAQVQSAYTHFTNGVWRVAQSAMDPNNSGTESLSGFGEVLLGGLDLVMALPAGVGAAVKQAAADFVPGLENTAALSPGLSSAIRTTLGLPAFILDPETRKAIVGDPTKTPAERMAARQALMDELNKPMTYGELMELGAMFAVPGIITRGLKARRSTTPVSEPLQVQTATGTPEAPRVQPTLPPEVAAGRLAKQAEQALIKEPGVAEPKPGAKVEAAGGRGAVREAGRPRPEEAAGPPSPDRPLPTAQDVAEGRAPTLEKSLDAAMRRADEMLRKDPDPALQQLVKEVDELQKRPTPTVEEVAGEPAPKPGAGKSAEELAKDVPGPKIPPDELIRKVEEEMKGRPAAEIEAEINRRMGVDEGEPLILNPKEQKLLDRAAKELGFESEAEAQGLKTGKLASKDRDFAKRLLEDFEAELDPSIPAQKKLANEIGRLSKKLGGEEKAPGISGPEAGAVDPGMLARMAIGAVIGGTQGDTPEERVTFALIGLGIGSVASKRVAKTLVARLKGDPATEAVLDPSIPKAPGFSQIDRTPIVERTIKAIAPDDAKAVNRVLEAGPEEILSREDVVSARTAETATWERVRQLAADIRDGVPVEPGDLKAAFALARTLNDHVNIPSRRMGATGTRGLARVKIAQERVGELARDWDPATSEKQLANVINELNTLEQVSLFGRLYYAVPEAITEAMYGSMLLGKAVVKNAIGNVPMVPISIVDRSIAQLFHSGPKVALSDAHLATMAVWESTIEQFRLIRSWEKLGEQARAMGSTHTEIIPRGFEGLADITRQFGPESQFTEAFARGMERLHSLASLGPGIMQRTDGMAKATHGRIGITWEAAQKARSEGLTGDAFGARVKELVDDYSKLDPDALVRVKRHRDRMTFTQEFEGQVMQALQRGPEDPWLNLAYRMSVAAFVRTPVRLMEVGADYTPGLNAISKGFRDDYMAGGLDRKIAMSKLATGTLVLGSFGWLAQQGLITGNLPTFKEGGVAVEHAGRPPQSFWDPLVQKYRSFKGMEPLTQWISIAADISYLAGQLPEKDAMRLITAYGVAVSNNLNITAFMQSISEFLDVAKSGRTDSQWEKSLEFIRRRLTVFIPAAVKEATKGDIERIVLSGAFDEDKSPMASVHRELRALTDEYQRGFGVSPGEGGNPPFLKVKRNMFTGQKLVDDTWPFNPFTTKPAQLAPWAEEVSRMRGAGLKPVPDWLGTEQPADIGLSDQPTAPGVRLTPPEIDRWEVLMTQEVKDRHGKLTDSLNELVTGERYLRFSDVTRRELLQERFGEFRDRAKATLLLENEPLRRALRDKRVESQIERLPRDRQPGARQRLGVGP